MLMPFLTHFPAPTDADSASVRIAGITACEQWRRWILEEPPRCFSPCSSAASSRLSGQW